MKMSTHELGPEKGPKDPWPMFYPHPNDVWLCYSWSMFVVFCSTWCSCIWYQIIMIEDPMGFLMVHIAGESQNLLKPILGLFKADFSHRVKFENVELCQDLNSHVCWQYSTTWWFFFKSYKTCTLESKLEEFFTGCMKQNIKVENVF